MRPSSSTLRIALWVVVLAFLLHATYFAEHAASAFFGVPTLDEAYYDGVGRALLAGADGSTLNPGFRPLLYPLFLAACYRLGGSWDVALTVAAQHLLGVLTNLLVVLLAIRLFRRPLAGALAGGLFLLAGPPLFFAGELLITTLFTFLLTLELWLLAGLGTAEDRGTRYALGAWAGAGLVAGLAAQARPNALLLVLAFPLVAWALQRRPWHRPLLRAGLAVVAVLAVQLAFALYYQALTGRFQLLPSAGGVNLYLGNKAGADGMIPRQDRPVVYGEAYRDSVQVFSEEVYAEAMATQGVAVSDPPDPRAVSRYWLGRTVEEVGRAPGRWLALMGRKVFFLTWNREIPNNKSYRFILAHESSLLPLLPVRWWLLFALAPLGAFWAWRHGERPLLLWLLAALGLGALGMVLFFVNSRYRIPLWPSMAVLAAGGLLALGTLVRRRVWRRLAVLGLGAAALAALSLSNPFAIPPQSFARDFFFRSVAQLAKGRLEAAEADARASLALEPTDAAARFQLGNVRLARGDADESLLHFRAAARLKPDEPRIHNNIGVAYEQLGQPVAAYRSYRKALARVAYPPALVNAALLELRAGLLDQAAARLAQAQALGFQALSLSCARAFLARDRGDLEQARTLLEAARREDPEATSRLLADNQQRLPASALAGGGKA